MPLNKVFFRNAERMFRITIGIFPLWTIFTTSNRSWAETIICPKNAFMVAENAIRLFKDFVEALFDTATLAALGEPASLDLVRSDI